MIQKQNNLSTNIPDGWEIIPQEDEQPNIPDGWEISHEKDRYGATSWGEVNKPIIKDITDETLDDRSFIEQVKDGAIDNTLIPMATAVQDAVNIVSPIGEVELLGENYNNPITGMKGDQSLVEYAQENSDLPLNAYNKLNKIAKTQYALIGDEKQGLETYQQNLADIVVNDMGFDDVQVDEDGKYYAVKGDTEVELNKDGWKEILSDVYGDKLEVAGSMLGATKGYQYGSKFGKKGAAIGTALGSAGGAMVGTVGDMVDSIVETGENLTLKQMGNEVLKSGALDAAATGVVAAVVNTPAALKGVKNYISDTSENIVNNNAQKYIKEDLNVDQTTSQDVENIAKSFGGKEDQTLTKLADQQDTGAILQDNFHTSLEQVNTYLDDMDTFSKNTYNKLGVKEIDDDIIATTDERITGNISNNINDLENHYKEQYNQTRNDILSIVGDTPIQANSKTLNTTKKLLNALSKPQNVKGETLSNGVPLTEFQKDYSNLVETINRNFKQEEDILDEAGNKVGVQIVDSDGYKLSKLMDVQKEYNQFFYKYKDQYIPKQQEQLSTIKDAIYDDMKNYIYKKFGGDDKSAKEVISKWESVNSDYGLWKADKGNFKEIDKILKSDIDITTLANDMITKTGKIDKNHIDFLGTVAKHLEKVEPQKLDELYGGVINNLLNKSSIKAPINGQKRRIIDFSEFIINYDKLQKQSLNKVFSGTKKGREIVDTLHDLRKIADYEDYIQQNLLKRGNNLTEAVKVATEHKQSFLFGVEYFFRRTLVGWLSDKLFRSEAYKTFINRLAKNRRYGKLEIDKAVKFTQNKMKDKSSKFTKEDKEWFKSIVKDAQEYEKMVLEQQKQVLKETQKAQTKQEQEMIMQKHIKNMQETMKQKESEIFAKGLPAPQRNLNDGLSNEYYNHKTNYENKLIQDDINTNYTPTPNDIRKQNLPTKEQLDSVNIPAQKLKLNKSAKEIEDALSRYENKSNKMVMTIKGEAITKTDFDKVQRFNEIRNYNLSPQSLTNGKKEIPEDLAYTYKRYENIADDLLDMEFKSDAPITDSYKLDDITDYMTKKELNEALAYTKTQNPNYKDSYDIFVAKSDEIESHINNPKGETITIDGKEEEWNLKNAPYFSKFGDNLFGGAIVGVETDEDGDIIGFDPAKFILGMAGVGAIKYTSKHFNKQFINKKETQILKNSIKKSAVPQPDKIEYIDIDVDKDKAFVLYKSIFGNGLVETPKGLDDVVISFYQYEKLHPNINGWKEDRREYLNLIKPTLEKPLMVVEFEDTQMFFKFFKDKKEPIKMVSVTKDKYGEIDVVSNYNMDKDSKFIKVMKHGETIYHAKQ